MSGIFDTLDDVDETTSISGAQLLFIGVVTNVLVNIVVLNLFVEYFDKVMIDRFTISVFTAVLLTVLLWLITRIEERVHHYFFDEHEGTGSRILGVAAIWAILFGSKFLILEVVDWVFGDHVELGKLIEVILLVIAMLVANGVMQSIFRRLGPAQLEVD
ncbi:MAG: hypothetical protein KJN63_03645 [Acidimicrobiia bacterium]|nr:hypothetical protein [Acidimicrobiia bacterium]